MTLTAAGCCLCDAHRAIPANRLPCEFQAIPRGNKCMIDLRQLGQDSPEEHRIGPNDLLSVYVNGVMPPKIDDAPVIFQSAGIAPIYYPPRGTLQTPSLGLPVAVSARGAVNLPLIGDVNVEGKTVDEATKAIREAYQESDVLAGNPKRVIVSLMRPRVERVLVIREDGDGPPTLISKTQYPLAKRGSSQVVDLPAYENDVLHALTAAGGMPGPDAYYELWIFKRGGGEDKANGLDDLQNQVLSSNSTDMMMDSLRKGSRCIRIPLTVPAGEPLPFTKDDVILESGDVVFISTRKTDFFYVGGTLPAGQIPMPRDYDIDVVEACTLANAAIGSAGIEGGKSAAPGGNGSPGSCIPPKRVLILRKLPNGQQIEIRVDLVRAKHDKRERILIQPGDFVQLQYRPGDYVANYVLNVFRINLFFDPTGG